VERRKYCFLYFFLFFSYPSTFFSAGAEPVRFLLFHKAAKGQIGGMTNFWKRIRSPQERGRFFSKPFRASEFMSFREYEIPLPNEQGNLTGLFRAKRR
jgi:hypothetical protein